MKYYITLLLLILFTWKVNSQINKDTVSIFEVKAKTIYGNINRNIPIDGYFVIITVANTQDTTTNFVLMTCDWTTYNFVTNTDSLSFKSTECDKDFPEKISLAPHQTITFYGYLFSRFKNCLNQKFRIGFIPYKTYEDINNTVISKKNKVNYSSKYWSNEIKLENNLFKYKLDNVSN